MDNTKSDQYYAERIRRDLRFIAEHMKDTDLSKLTADEVLLDSMIFRLIQVSENARKLTEGYKSAHADIPWTAMYGLRNRLVHDYGNADLNIVYRTLKTNVPEILRIFEA